MCLSVPHLGACWSIKTVTACNANESRAARLQHRVLVSAVDGFHVPIVISFPHFYMAEPRYVDGVIGMHPSSEFVTEVKLEPVSSFSTPRLVAVGAFDLAF